MCVVERHKNVVASGVDTEFHHARRISVPDGDVIVPHDLFKVVTIRDKVIVNPPIRRRRLSLESFDVPHIHSHVIVPQLKLDHDGDATQRFFNFTVSRK